MAVKKKKIMGKKAIRVIATCALQAGCSFDEKNQISMVLNT